MMHIKNLDRKAIVFATIFCAAVALAVIGAVHASDAEALAITDKIEKDGAVYTYSISNGEATIARIEKAADNAASTYEALIPDSIEVEGKAYLVTALADNVMNTDVVAGAAEIKTTTNSELTKLVIPAKVLSIGNEAFAGCAALTALVFSADDDGTQHLESIGDYAFYGSGIDNACIPDTVTSIGVRAFAACESIGMIKLPACQTSIDVNAFRNTTNMTTIVIPDGCTCVPRLDIKNVKTITIPSSVTGSVQIHQSTVETGLLESLVLPEEATLDLLELSIGNASVNRIPKGVKTLMLNGSFESVDLPDSLEKIESLNSANLSEARIPANVAELGTSCFSGDRTLDRVVFEEGSRVAQIPRDCFAGCSALQNVQLPTGLTVIMNEAFRGCASLQSIVVPSSIRSIQGVPFTNCDSLESIQFAPGGSKSCSISGLASSCQALSDVVLSGSVQSITGLVSGCPSLEAIYTYSPQTSISEFAVKDSGDFKVYGWGAAGSVLEYAESTAHEFVPYAELDASAYNRIANAFATATSAVSAKVVCRFSAPGSFDYERELVEGSDFTLAVIATDGLGYLQVIGNGKTCFGTVTIAAKQDISQASMATIPTQIYRGMPCEPKPKIILGNNELALGIDYSLVYRGNDRAGTATIVAMGKGSYIGELSSEFEVRSMQAVGSGDNVANALAAVEQVEATDTVIVCWNHDYAGMAASSTFSSMTGYPLVVIENSGLDDEVLQRLMQWGARSAIVIGGATSCGEQTIVDLNNLGITCENVDASSSSALAVDIESMIDTWGKEAVIANPSDVSMLLPVASYAAASDSPLFFSEDDGTLSPETRQALRHYGAAVIVGDYTSVDCGADDVVATMIRVQDLDDAGLSLALAQYGEEAGVYEHSSAVYLATAFDGPSFISYAVKAGQGKDPVLLVEAKLDDRLSTYISAHAATTKTYLLLESDKGSLQEVGNRLAALL